MLALRHVQRHNASKEATNKFGLLGLSAPTNESFKITLCQYAVLGRVSLVYLLSTFRLQLHQMSRMDLAEIAHCSAAICCL
jgi:hypothetical protein